MSDEHHDYRAYAGRVAGGILTPGEEVVVLPSGRRTRIAAIETADGELPHAFPPMSVSVRLEDDLDVSRGDLIARVADAPEPVRELEATVCWMDERPLRARGRYVLKHTTRSVKAIVEAVEGRLDVTTLEQDPAADELRLNDIGRVRLRTSAPLMLDPYAANRETGGFILIDEATNSTVGAGMVAG
jgi:bifunctional enzyme CysN/CysC/sulfate adenylyltransferase subunit 1